MSFSEGEEVDEKEGLRCPGVVGLVLGSVTPSLKEFWYVHLGREGWAMD